MSAVVIPLRDIPVVPGLQNEVAVPTQDQWMLDFFGPKSAAGVVVNATSAQRVATNYACVTRIAGGITTMPLRIYERVWDAKSGTYGRKPVDDLNMWWLLNERPTAAFSAASHWEHVLQCMLLRGDGFSEIGRKRSGAIGEFIPQDWHAVRPERRSNGRLMYVLTDGYNSRTLDQDDMLHFPGFGFDGVRAHSVISYAARSAIGNALAMDEYSGRFFKDGAHHNMVLESDKKMDPELILSMQRMFGEKYSGLANAHGKPMVLTEGLKARAVTMSAEDAQLIEARRYQVIDICRAYGVPPHMVGESSASTAWGSGLESLRKGFLAYTLEPPLVRCEQELNHKLFRSPRYYLEFDREAYDVGDLKGQAEADKASLGGPGSGPGYRSVNEIRRKKNLPPVDDPKYDVPYWPPEKTDGAAAPARPEPREPEPRRGD